MDSKIIKRKQRGGQGYIGLPTIVLGINGGGGGLRNNTVVTIMMVLTAVKPTTMEIWWR